MATIKRKRAELKKIRRRRKRGMIFRVRVRDGKHAQLLG